MDDARIATRLMGRERRFLVEHRHLGAGIATLHGAGGGQADDAGTDHDHVEVGSGHEASKKSNTVVVAENERSVGPATSSSGNFAPDQVWPAPIMRQYSRRWLPQE